MSVFAPLFSSCEDIRSLLVASVGCAVHLSGFVYIGHRLQSTEKASFLELGYRSQ